MIFFRQNYNLIFILTNFLPCSEFNILQRCYVFWLTWQLKSCHVSGIKADAAQVTSVSTITQLHGRHDNVEPCIAVLVVVILEDIFE